MQSNKIKRSKSINLVSMRKSFSVKPLALGIAAIFLTACGNDQDAAVFTSADDCTNANPEFAEKCKTAYEDAVKEAERTGPKYNSQSDCETEFGNNQCRVVQRDSGFGSSVRAKSSWGSSSKKGGWGG